MIVDYYRPKDVAGTLELLANKKLKVVLIGGGTTLNRYGPEPIAVVDLQDVGLNNIRSRGSVLEIGATVPLQGLLDHPSTNDSLREAIHLETSLNRRNIATVAGTLVASDGRSPFCTVMLTMDASLKFQPGDENISLGDLLAIREVNTSDRLITSIDIPLNVSLASSFVARTPADLPLVFASVCVWPSGRTRVGLGGYGQSPILVLDGPNGNGVLDAASDAYSHAGDQWASGEYRHEIARVLVRRCLAQLNVELQ